jgi:hypothetical protein
MKTKINILLPVVSILEIEIYRTHITKLLHCVAKAFALVSYIKKIKKGNENNKEQRIPVNGAITASFWCWTLL